MPVPDAATVLVLGAGRAGLAVAAALAASGVTVVVASRSTEGRARAGGRGLDAATAATRATTWILAVPDDAVGAVATRLAAHFDGSSPDAALPSARPDVVLHLSGATPVTVLSPLAALGIASGGLHPLQTLTFSSAPTALHGVPAAVGGDPAAEAAARTLAGALGMRPFAIDDAARPRYHAAGALAANFTVTLLDLAITLAERSGMPAPLAREGLAGLAAAAAARVRDEGAADALTGPIRRGDPGVVGRHLGALDAEDAALYRTLADRTLALAVQAGLDRGRAAQVQAVLAGRPA